MRKPLIIILSLFVIYPLLNITGVKGYSAGIAGQSSASLLDMEKLKWTWRKRFKDMDIRNLEMAWNGSRILFSVRERVEKAESNAKGDVIIGLEFTGRPIRDWRVDGRIKRLSLDGSGKRLLAELDDGRLLYYSDWERDEEPLIIKDTSGGAALSPNGRFIGVIKKSRQNGIVHVLSEKGEVIWDYSKIDREDSKIPEQVSSNWQDISFPFLEKENRLLMISKEGRISFYDGEKLLWQQKIQGRPNSLTSSLLEGGVLMIAAKGDKEGIHFFNDKGEATGFASIKGIASSLSCSNIGNICAAYINSQDGQYIHVYTPDGKIKGKYHKTDPVEGISRVYVTDNGGVIFARIKEKGRWLIVAVDHTGALIWQPSIKGDVKDFKVSWNGKQVVVITEDGRIEFFQDNEVTKVD